MASSDPAALFPEDRHRDPEEGRAPSSTGRDHVGAAKSGRDWRGGAQVDGFRQGFVARGRDVVEVLELLVELPPEDCLEQLTGYVAKLRRTL